jgi:hypothetical protein
MFRLAWMAALLVVALPLAAGRANDPGPSFGGRGAQYSFSLEGRLYERLRLTGYASFGRFDVWAERVKGGQAFDFVIKHRGPAEEVNWRARVAVMELRSDRGGKRLLARTQNGEAQGSDGSRAEWADRTFEVELP